MYVYFLCVVCCTGAKRYAQRSVCCTFPAPAFDARMMLFLVYYDASSAVVQAYNHSACVRPSLCRCRRSLCVPSKSTVRSSEQQPQSRFGAAVATVVVKMLVKVCPSAWLVAMVSWFGEWFAFGRFQTGGFTELSQGSAAAVAEVSQCV